MIPKPELARKAIHFLGLLYIPGILILGKNLMAVVVILLTAFGVLVEIARRKYVVIPEDILRDYEKRNVGAFIYTGIAFSVITPFFPQDACLIASACAFAGDGVAGIFKKVDKRLSFPSFFLPSFLVAYSLNLPIVQSLLAIILAYIFDGRKFLNDNFTIPFAAAITYVIVEIIHYRML